MKNDLKTQEIVVYRGAKGNVTLQAQIESETIWATLNQIADVFGVQKAAVSKHLKNIYETKELLEKTTVSKMETVQTEGKRTVRRDLAYYNLDAIIAVGYRVNSKQATQFRIWATETLREFLLHGYVVDRKRLIESKWNTLKELEKTVAFIQSTIAKRTLVQDELQGVLSVVRDYAGSFLLLDQYDKRDVTIAKGVRKTVPFSYEVARAELDILKKELIKRREASDLFAIEREAGLQSIIGNIHQSFHGVAIYRTVEERAAHLLYFTVKNHPFADGNKRSAAFLFIRFLEKNRALYNKKGEKKITDNALTALTLLIAESDPKEKEQMVALITQLIK